MSWIMIPCILLLGAIALGSGKSPPGYLWPILIGIFVVVHIWMMLRRHGRHKDDSAGDKIDSTPANQPETKDGNNKHKSSGCCH